MLENLLAPWGVLPEDPEEKARREAVASQLTDIADPSSPDYSRRHGGSFVTGLADALASAISLPGDVWSGAVDPRSEEGFSRTQDLAGLAMTGGLAGASVKPGEAALGATYFRRTAGPHPDNGAGYMMFADDLDRIGSYGRNAWKLDTDEVPAAAVIDASDPRLRKQAYRAFREIETPDVARSLVDEMRPSDIVNSAGVWDSHDHLVPLLWDKVLEPNGWRVVTTPNGALSFDPDYVRPLSGR